MVLLGLVIALTSEENTLRQFAVGSFLHGKLTPGIVIVFIGIQMLWLPACDFASFTAGITPLFQKLYKWSEQITMFYFIQWVIIGWLCVVCPEIPAWAIVPMIALVLFLTDATVTRTRRMLGR